MSVSPTLSAPGDDPPMRLADVERWLDESRLPPVERWNPPHRGHSGMRIAADGTWFHEGAPIRRERLVRLFSRVLRREADGFVLVTPAEKLTIDVEDAPFIAVEAASEGTGSARRIAFRLGSGDYVVAGPSHPLRVRGDEERVRPYVEVRGGLWARLGRPAWYALAEAAADEGHDPPGLWSRGVFFPFTPEAG